MQKRLRLLSRSLTSHWRSSTLSPMQAYVLNGLLTCEDAFQKSGSFLESKVFKAISDMYLRTTYGNTWRVLLHSHLHSR